MLNKFFTDYMSNIIPVAFNLQSENETKKIGSGDAKFTVILKKPISKSDLITSTSLALGEAYMRGDIEVDKDLYEVLNLFL